MLANNLGKVLVSASEVPRVPPPNKRLQNSDHIIKQNKAPRSMAVEEKEVLFQSNKEQYQVNFALDEGMDIDPPLMSGYLPS